MKFLDEAKIFIRSGNGGPGCLSFRREKYVEFGGPDGGNGGRGGDVTAVAVPALNTLIDYRYHQHFKAASGQSGAGANRSGAGGASATLRLPVGTQILEDDRETVIADLTESGQSVCLLRGGDGGRGNAAFKSSTNRAPRRVEPGFPGAEKWVWLRLKLIADAGLLGMPNAGKSTLLAAVSNARPRIADYPFTTLHPNLGVVAVDGHEFVMADIPGLVAGAHLGRCIGDRFLGHVERCRVLLHLVDAAGEDPLEAYRTVRREVLAYGHGLADKPEVVALTKTDAVTEQTAAPLRRALADAARGPVLEISAVSGQGLQTALRALWQEISRQRTVAAGVGGPEKEGEGAAWTPL